MIIYYMVILNVVDKLFDLLLKLYLKELVTLSIGYPTDSQRLDIMWELMLAIDFIQNGDPTSSEFFKIVAYYE